MGSTFLNLLAILALLGMLAGGSLFWPRLAFIALWSACYLYPHAMTAQALPFNVGGDDLAVVIILGAVLARRFLSGQRMVMGPVVAAGIVALLLEIFSSFIGLLLSQEYPVVDFVKAIVKHSRPILIALIVVNACDNLDELRRALYGFILFSSLAFVVVVAQNLGVRSLDMFITEHWLQYRYEVGTERYSGVFGGPWALAAVAVLVAPLSLALLALGTIRMKVLALFGLASSVAAVFYAQSRGGMVALGVSFLAAPFVIRRRVMAISVLLLVVLGVTGTGLVSVVAPRWRKAGVQEYLSGQGGSQTPLQQRLQIMADNLRGVPPIGLVTGVGQDVIRVFTVGKAHNIYLQIWLGYGIPGLMLAGWILYVSVRRLREAASLPLLLPTSALREGLLLSIVGVLVLGLTAEVVGGQEFHDALMAMAAMAWLHLRMARAVTDESELMPPTMVPALYGGAAY